MKKNYDVIIFDLDGTLMDTSPGVTASVRYALRKMGLKDDDAARIRRFIGPPLHMSFVEFYGMSDADAEKAVAFYRENYSARGVLEYTPYPGMMELIRLIAQSGRKVGIATGKPMKFASVILEDAGVMPFIGRIVTPSLSDTKDNKPRLIREIMDALGENALMVGDRCFDIDGANANGLDSAGVLQGFGSEEELKKSGATYIVEGAQGLREIIL